MFEVVVSMTRKLILCCTKFLAVLCCIDATSPLIPSGGLHPANVTRRTHPRHALLGQHDDIYVGICRTGIG